ncbi:X-Pro dipeptidyl-peptidase (S15 family) [Verrucomicrobiia bacterium DG1235]|nr:X-Pro dipeptidyl-peptidase (S15 family) [Verrucomicrobiae bacterium DG1235]
MIPLLILFSSLTAWGKGVPVETLFKKPEFASFQVSPNGEYLAVLAPFERRLNIHVIELATMNINRVTGIKDTDIAGFQWITDDRIFFQMDNGGDEYYGTFAINRDGSNPVTIMPMLSDDASFTIPRYTRVIDTLDDQPDFVLVANNEDRAEHPDIFLLNIHTGRKKIHLSNPGNVSGWITDHNGIVRIGAVRNEKVTDVISSGLVYRNSEEEEFRELVPYSEDEPKLSPLAFDYDGKTLYVSTRPKGEKTAGIYTFDLETKELGELIFRDETYDIGGVFVSDFTKKLSGYGIDRDKPEFVWLDEEKAQIQKAMDDAFPDTINSPTSMSDDESVMVYTSYSSRQPAFYNLISLRGGTLKLTPLGKSREWIKPETQSEQEPYTIEARDGTTLHGYIWFPPNADRKNLPLIVNPHGGPNARDSYGWDPRVQFFTTRGFAVLQVNFRGSEGYGYDFIKAGHKKWWYEMQYDVRDAVQWAIDQGYADEKKIGIYGGSYGGYAVMAQLTKYPELYNFGINVVGVVDTEEMLKYEKATSDSAFAFWQSRIGKLDDDIDMIRESSPINHLERLDDPVFIIHGVRDPRVPIKQAEMLRSAMKKKKKKFEWLVKRDEGHGFRKEENQFIQFNRMEDFIAPFMKKWGMN